MKKRYDKLVVVRSAASHTASAAFADSAAYLMGQETLARRLEDAAAALSPETGVGSGSELAARCELATRMQSARRITQGRLHDARSDHDNVAMARRAARRALDAATDIRRTHDRAEVARLEAKVVPVRPKDMAP